MVSFDILITNWKKLIKMNEIVQGDLDIIIWNVFIKTHIEFFTKHINKQKLKLIFIAFFLLCLIWVTSITCKWFADACNTNAH